MWYTLLIKNIPINYLVPQLFIIPNHILLCIQKHVLSPCYFINNLQHCFANPLGPVTAQHSKSSQLQRTFLPQQTCTTYGRGTTISCEYHRIVVGGLAQHFLIKWLKLIFKRYVLFLDKYGFAHIKLMLDLLGGGGHTNVYVVLWCQ